MSGNRSGDTLNFKITPTGTPVIPAFRMTCGPGWGHSFPVSRVEVEKSIPAKDGEQIVIDLGAMGGGRVTGRNTYTLHLCQEEK